MRKQLLGKIGFGVALAACGDNAPPALVSPSLVVTRLTASQTTEIGGVVSFQVQLVGTPSGDVTVPIVSSDSTEGTPSTNSLVFSAANAGAPQKVTITGMNDEEADGAVAYDIDVGPATSGDTRFVGLRTSVRLTNLDNETAGYIVSPVEDAPTENGDSAFFTVALTAAPTSDVVIAIESSDPTEGILAVPQLTFTPINYAAPQEVRVTGVDDDLQDGPIEFSIQFTGVTTTDPNYAAAALPSALTLTSVDNDTAGILVSDVSGPTTEQGEQAQLTVVLATQPTADVVIGVSTDDTSEGTLADSTLTFTPANWSAPQTVIITGQNDDLADGNQLYHVVFAAATSADVTYAGLTAASADVINLDDETAGIFVREPSGDTSESGDVASVEYVLTSQPTADVTLTFESSDATEGVLTASTLTFTSANWNAPQAVTVTGQDDSVADGNQVYQVSLVSISSEDAAYAGLSLPAPVQLTNLDDETPGLLVTAIEGDTSEDGDAATFTVALQSEPTADVIVTLASDDETEGTASPPTLTFTAENWNAPQVVTVTGANDDLADGNQPYHIEFAPSVSADANYDGLLAARVDVVNVDDDSAGITVTVTEAASRENGQAALLDIVLTSEPTADVTVTFASSDASEGVTNVAAVTFTAANWAAPQTVMVAGQDDAIQDGNQPYRVDFSAATSADANYAGLVPASVELENIDNDSAGVSVSLISGDTREDGTQATFAIVLNSEPTADVTVTFASDATDEGTLFVGSRTFTAANWNAPQLVTVTGQDDNVQDGNQPYQIDFSAATSADSNYAGIVPSSVDVINVDNDSAGFVVNPAEGDTREDGTSTSFTVHLTSEPTADVTLNFASDDVSEGVATTTSLVFTPATWNVPQSIVVEGVDDAVADGNQPYQVDFGATISADATYAALIPTSADLVNIDDDSADFTVTTASANTTEAGGTATFSVVLNSEPIADVTVNLGSSDASEGIANATALTFTSANWNTPQVVTVTGQDDAVQDGNQPYQIVFAATTSADPAYAAIAPASVALVNDDNDSAGIVVGALTNYGETNEAGGTAQFTVVLTTEPTSDVTVAFASTNATEGATNVPSLLFTSANWSTPQTVTVTGQDDGLTDGYIEYQVVFSASTSADANYVGIVSGPLNLMNADNEADPCAPPPDARLVWQLDLGAGGYNWDTQAQVPYTTNRAAALAGTTYTRVSYCLNLNGVAVYTEMDDYTNNDLSRVMFPTDHIVDQAVNNLTVVSTAGNVASVSNTTGGKLEFWPNCYSQGPGLYDADDTLDSNDCYGSFQVHRDANTLFAFNRWSTTFATTEMGHGNQVGGSGHPDWTFSANSAAYTSRRITAYVRPPAASCRAALEQKSTSPSGVYQIDPDGAGGVAARDMYCDMTSHGGGWTLIGKTAAGNYVGLTSQQYTDLIANPVAHVNPALLLSAAVPAAGQMAFYDRFTTNALYHNAGGRVVRVEMSGNLANAAANGTYFQQKFNPPPNWDFWAGIRNALLWNSSGMTSGSSITGGGVDFAVTSNPAQFNAATNTVTHSGSSSFGWWDTNTLTLNGGGTLQVTRHMGLLCDFSQPWQWLLTSNPSDSRWRADVSSQQRSLIWLR